VQWYKRQLSHLSAALALGSSGHSRVRRLARWLLKHPDSGLPRNCLIDPPPLETLRTEIAKAVRPSIYLHTNDNSLGQEIAETLAEAAEAVKEGIEIQKEIAGCAAPDGLLKPKIETVIAIVNPFAGAQTAAQSCIESVSKVSATNAMKVIRPP
jgi:hypothetical protein